LAFDILAVYEAAWYSGEQAIYETKSIDNTMSHYNGLTNEEKWERTQKSLVKTKNI